MSYRTTKTVRTHNRHGIAASATNALGMALYALGMVLAIITAWLVFATEASADSFDTYMQRCEPYRARIEQILEEEGVPKEYFALLLAESGCDFENVSEKGAMGPWQMMGYTAKVYGVTDPYDLEQSTRGAARYLKSLMKRFDGMEWVIAAYNAGGTNLKRVTGYPNAKFSKVRSVRPEAYNLAMKVNSFVRRIKTLDQKMNSQNSETDSKVTMTEPVTSDDGHAQSKS